ncbi:FtsX-like permease family protein [Holdemania sp. 1001302B_160321_E10]|uniref:FtsX-like permease family protein n=1 Tax=Holdemania sp. 1001302B_160321_E10 TaxID=2787120 RepID=UPI00189A93AB|nr:FtsX-like permease family protein [Holdemania sp. 1001302B_160321_E10]
MRSPLLKDTLREIRKTRGRFFSIFGIVAIGVAFFAGVLASAPDMKYTADRYFDDYNLMDYRVVSNFGITEDDVRQLRQVAGVQGVQASYTQDVITRIGSKELVLKVHALDLEHLDPQDPDYINQLVVTSGRLPEKSGECVIEDGKIVVSGMKIGDTIKIESGTSDPLDDSFSRDTFTIVGTVNTPYYLSYEKGTSTIGSGSVDTYVYVPKNDFTMEVYTDVYLTARGAKPYNSYNQDYFDYLEPLSETLTTLGSERAELRRQSIVDEAMKEYTDGQAEYDEALTTFNTEIEKTEKKLQEGKDELLVGQATLTSSKAMAEAQLKQGEAQIEMIQKQIDTLVATYDEKKKEYETTNAQALEQKAALESQIAEKQKNLADKQTELAPAEQELNEQTQKQLDLTTRQVELETKKALNQTDPEKYPALSEEEAAELEKIPGELILVNARITELQGELAVLTQLETEITTAQAQLDLINQGLEVSETVLKTIDEQIVSANAQIEQQRQTLVQAKAEADKQIAEGEAKLKQGQKEVAQGEIDLALNKAEGEAKLEDAREELVLAKNKIEQIEQGKWYILDRQSHYSYMDYKGAADRMAAIAKVFPVFFFLVAALVCLTTMTRMVDEQRSQIGTMKALGYTTGQIAFKYVFYAAFASLTGSLVGLAVGLFAFPAIIYTAWLMMYVLPPVSFTPQLSLMIGSTAASVLVTTLAAFAACYKELIETPALLMRPKAPKLGKKILIERMTFVWKRFSFTSKVTARNLFRYKKRFFMTVLGISGCTALLVAGFGIKDSISRIVNSQFGEIFQYQGIASLQKDLDETEKQQVFDQISSLDMIDDSLDVYQSNAVVYQGNDSTEVTLVVTSDPERFRDFVSLHPRKQPQEELRLKDSGVVITEKMANDMNLHIGDTIELENEKELRRNVEITGIAENYLNHYVYMNANAYKETYDLRAQSNAVFLKFNPQIDDAEQRSGQELLKNEKISSLSFYTGIKDNFNNMIRSLNYIVLVLIISAGMLAFVVLYNLTNVNISERLREIATLKVLGFYNKEVNTYVYKENIILTLIGSLLGLGLGKILHLTIMVVVELDNIMFGRVILPQSYVISVLITMLFAVIVNQVMKSKLRAIPMVESLKSVE